MPIDVKLESEDGNVNIKITTFTADRVIGNMKVIDWNKYKKQWPFDDRFPTNCIETDYRCTDRP